MICFLNFSNFHKNSEKMLWIFPMFLEIVWKFNFKLFPWIFFLIKLKKRILSDLIIGGGKKSKHRKVGEENQRKGNKAVDKRGQWKGNVGKKGNKGNKSGKLPFICKKK